MASLPSKHKAAIKISVIFLVVSSAYIVLSDLIILQFCDSYAPDELFRIHSYKGLAFVWIIAILLFSLIQREINIFRSYISKLENQQKTMKQVIAEKNEIAKKFYTLFRFSPIPIVFTRFKDGKILEANDSYIALFGYSREELIHSLPEKISIWKNNDEKRRMLELLQTQNAVYDFKAQAVRKDGKVIKTLSSLKVVDTGGEKSIIAIIQDVTEAKKNEQELTESKNLLEKTINNLNEVVIVADQTRTIVMANAPVETIFGYKPQEITGKSTALFHISEDSFRKLAELGRPELEQNGIYRTNYPMQRKDGAIIETEIITTVIREKDGWRSGIISVIRDVTERVKNERKLQEYQESLKQLTIELSLAEEKQRKEIAVNIHDHLSQLLVVSKIRLNELLEHLHSEVETENVKVVISYISEALERSRKITYDLSPPILYEMGLVETMYWFAEKTSEEQGIETVFHSDFDKINLAESKLILIYRIIQELVNNAIKHAQPNRLEILFALKNGNFEIMVLDNGKGFVVDGVLSTKIKKGGFGLFAVRERINNLGGNFTLESKPGMGTEVKINVPLN